ncbi:hypothetical protein Slin14017_G085050 [Septoria linicola]|nr:hypothetical protein Slin14017_G085050 [Septoria linicola]
MRVTVKIVTGQRVPRKTSSSMNHSTNPSGSRKAPVVHSSRLSTGDIEAAVQQRDAAIARAGRPCEVDFAWQKYETTVNPPVPYGFASRLAFDQSNNNLAERDSGKSLERKRATISNTELSAAIGAESEVEDEGERDDDEEFQIEQTLKRKRQDSIIEFATSPLRPSPESLALTQT